MLFNHCTEKNHTVFDLAVSDLFLLEYVPINDQNIVCCDCDGVVPEINENCRDNLPMMMMMMMTDWVQTGLKSVF
jgi:hypothetical protein